MLLVLSLVRGTKNYGLSNGNLSKCFIRCQTNRWPQFNLAPKMTGQILWCFQKAEVVVEFKLLRVIKIIITLWNLWLNSILSSTILHYAAFVMFTQSRKTKKFLNVHSEKENEENNWCRNPFPFFYKLINCLLSLPKIRSSFSEVITTTPPLYIIIPPTYSTLYLAQKHLRSNLPFVYGWILGRQAFVWYLLRNKNRIVNPICTNWPN